MAVVYWSARLAVNEEVRVRSPPVTPQEQLGVGQWLATWPGTRSTQVRFLPPRRKPHTSAAETLASRWTSTRAAHWVQGCCKQPARVRFPRGPPLWTTRKCRRPLKAQDRVRLPAGSRRPIGLRGDGCRTFNPENGVRLPDGTRFESAAEWSATGPENRGGGDEPQRFDSSTRPHLTSGPQGVTVPWEAA